MSDTPFIARGFHRRRAAGPAGRLPPGQYETQDFPVLSAGPTPRVAARHVGLHDPRRRRPRAAVVVGRAPGTPARDADGRHPLCHEVVEVRHDAGKASRSIRCSPPRAGKDSAKARSSSRSPTVAIRRIFRSPTSRAARRGSCSTSTARRSRPSTAVPRDCSCRTCISGRAPSGCAGFASCRATSPASGSSSAITIAAIPGSEQRYQGDP